MGVGQQRLIDQPQKFTPISPNKSQLNSEELEPWSSNPALEQSFEPAKNTTEEAKKEDSLSPPGSIIPQKPEKSKSSKKTKRLHLPSGQKTPPRLERFAPSTKNMKQTQLPFSPQVQKIQINLSKLKTQNENLKQTLLDQQKRIHELERREKENVVLIQDLQRENELLLAKVPNVNLLENLNRELESYLKQTIMEPHTETFNNSVQPNRKSSVMEIEKNKENIQNLSLPRKEHKSIKTSKNSYPKPAHENYKKMTRNSVNPAIFIPWKGKILTPTPSQLRHFEGNLNKISVDIGSRDPVGKEVKFREIRILWKGKILAPSPVQLLECKGDLNVLTTILATKNPNHVRFHQHKRKPNRPDQSSSINSRGQRLGNQPDSN